MKNHRLLIVSNRLPIVVKRHEGKLSVTTGSGGLVTALAPVLRNRGGTWIGWPGIADLKESESSPITKEASKVSGFNFEPVLLTKKEVENYYVGFSNEVIWPLFHDLQTVCNFDPDYWETYQHVNKLFADAVEKVHHPEDFIWVHDYQQMLLGQELRKKGITNRLGFFLHIPFPPLDIFLKLPWRFQIIRALLEYDLVGFQTQRDRRNFIQCVRTLLKDVDQKSAGSLHVFKVNDRMVRVGSFPISIDYNEFERLAKSKEVEKLAWNIHEQLPERKLILSVDRLDYTKGIPYRLEAFKMLLLNHPELIGKVSMVQVVVPSRTDIPRYQELKEEIDRKVGELNSRFTSGGWVPIHYMYRSLKRVELLSYYRTSEVAFVTPIKDGMNLVAKEYIASDIDEKGVLVLSEFAGAAAELHEEALLVNPYDVVGMSQALFKALNIPEDERHKRMVKMRRLVKKHDIFWWVHSFLNAAISKELVDFPLVSEYIPDDQSSLSNELLPL